MARNPYDVTFSPFIIALDVSGSMERDENGNHPLEAAAQIIPKLTELGTLHPTVDIKTRVGLITFSTDAEVQLRIGDTGCLSELDSSGIALKAAGSTNYGAAFDLIRAELEQFPSRIFRRENLDGLRVAFHRPVIFFITDGRPNDDQQAREAAWRKLVNPDSEFSPHFMTCGIGNVKAEDIAKYRNRRGRVILAKDPSNVAGALTDLVELLAATIVSVSDGSGNTTGDGEADDMPIYDEAALSENFDVIDNTPLFYSVL